MNTELSIIVTWRNRAEIARAIPTLLESAKACNGAVSVVNFGGDRLQLHDLLGNFRKETQVIDVGEQAYFNKSAAQNVGAACSNSDWMFFCDCDILLDPAVLRDLLNAVRLEPRQFGTLAGVRETETNSRQARHVVSFGYTLRITTQDGRRLEIVDNEEDARDGTRQAPGLLLVRREDFLRIAGYNSELHGWGWEDQDMISRLTLGAGLKRITRGTAEHISHDDHARVAHYPLSDRWHSRDRMFRQALANYDEARFSGTFTTDASRYAPAGSLHG